MVVFGGIGSRVVASATDGQPLIERQVLGDVFELSLATRDWRQVDTVGKLPCARYVASAAMFLWSVPALWLPVSCAGGGS